MFSSLLLSLGERLATFTLFSDQRGKKSPDGSDSPEPSKVQTHLNKDHAQQVLPAPAPRKRRKPRE
jgi:hypothetical protein